MGMTHGAGRRALLLATPAIVAAVGGGRVGFAQALASERAKRTQVVRENNIRAE